MSSTIWTNILEHYVALYATATALGLAYIVAGTYVRKRSREAVRNVVRQYTEKTNLFEDPVRPISLVIDEARRHALTDADMSRAYAVYLADPQIKLALDALGKDAATIGMEGSETVRRMLRNWASNVAEKTVFWSTFGPMPRPANPLARAILHVLVLGMWNMRGSKFISRSAQLFSEDVGRIACSGAEFEIARPTKRSISLATIPALVDGL